MKKTWIVEELKLYEIYANTAREAIDLIKSGKFTQYDTSYDAKEKA